MTSELHLHRTGTRRGVARNGRGATLHYGPVEEDGSFTPGELLALALAACHLMSADHVLARRLEDDGFRAEATVHPEKDAAENRYAGAHVELAVDLDGLDESARQQLAAVVARAVERSCTVGRTLDAGMPHTLAIVPG